MTYHHRVLFISIGAEEALAVIPGWHDLIISGNTVRLGGSRLLAAETTESQRPWSPPAAAPRASTGYQGGSNYDPGAADNRASQESIAWLYETPANALCGVVGI